MVNYCAIIGCNRTGGKDKVSFFRLPAVITNQGEKTQELSEKRRRLWISRISRSDLQPASYPFIRVCSDHFVNGKPSPLYPEGATDWTPTLNLGHPKCNTEATPTPDRENRLKGRQQKRKTDNTETDSKLESDEPEFDCKTCSFEEERVSACGTKTTRASQTDLGCSTLKAMESELNRRTVETMTLKDIVAKTNISEETFKNDDEKVKLYTGLPSFVVLMTLFNFIEPDLTQSANSALSKFQKVILVLMRLKLNLSVQYLADQFKVSQGTVSKTFINTLNVMYVKMQPLIYWPSQEERRLTMPMEFRKYFGLKIAVIIDCFEIFIERPSNLVARAQTWSSYKHHNTVKYLIGISPQGAISYISQGYGGRASDKFVTNDSGFLEKLQYGDVVLADRGFDIAESVAQASSEVIIPAFTKGKSQLSAVDIEKTRKLAHVRIHVERVIGLVRNKYIILQDTLPLDYLISSDGSTPTIDKIVTVCCALTNMCKSVVPFD
ncbi:hypothetical protein ACJMK2_023144 [Sinanodonta woodiana]|uniref:THAP-type domain-containing protein n=1 Tax=Sinanodonta woodiana TaxID=1069815 RepID=A0ABD3T3A0_SINWO